MSERQEPALSRERAEYLRKLKIRKHAILTARILILVAFFAVWEIAGNLRLIDPFLTSQPSRIIRTLSNLYMQGDLFKHIGITCLETVAGFLLGTVLGTGVAILLWWSDFISRVLEPYLVVLNSLPKIALGPIFIIWIGPGPSAIIVMALAISLIVTILEVLNGFLSADPEKIRLVETFGANRLQVFTKVVLPSNIGSVINALKINVGLSWVGVIVGEFLVSRAGLGYLIVYGGQVFQLDLVMTSVIILAAAAALMYQGVVWIERKLMKNPQVYGRM
ncbi:MAG TPA: ABC transporter permease [Thermoclostridium sp.]|nr:ABC transporter permease [Clostridiaceae bacterium]HOQ75209.1 ABC transporter permease [Thermoclostridium sp.]HPU44728.1 ABC transporter permease [Thermoclostridium sp.]